MHLVNLNFFQLGGNTGKWQLKNYSENSCILICLTTSLMDVKIFLTGRKQKNSGNFSKSLYEMYAMYYNSWNHNWNLSLLLASKVAVFFSHSLFPKQPLCLQVCFQKQKTPVSLQPLSSHPSKGMDRTLLRLTWRRKVVKGAAGKVKQDWICQNHPQLPLMPQGTLTILSVCCIKNILHCRFWE